MDLICHMNLVTDILMGMGDADGIYLIGVMMMMIRQ